MSVNSQQKKVVKMKKYTNGREIKNKDVVIIKPAGLPPKFGMVRDVNPFGQNDRVTVLVHQPESIGGFRSEFVPSSQLINIVDAVEAYELLADGLKVKDADTQDTFLNRAKKLLGMTQDAPAAQSATQTSPPPEPAPAAQPGPQAATLKRPGNGHK
jgi:hypothetical protein